jgi:preprotein translocase subunit SecG
LQQSVFFITGLLSGIIIVYILKQYSKGNENSIFIKSNSYSYDLLEDGQPNALGAIALVMGIVLIVISIPRFIACIHSIIRWITIPEIQLLSDLKGILSEH